MLAAEMERSEQNIRDFFYFKKRDPETGAVSAAASGYFFNDSEYARFHTEQRVGLTKGNPKDLEQWCNVFIYDIYTIGGGAAAGRSEEPLRAAHPDQGTDLPVVRRQGAVHPDAPHSTA